MSPMTQAQYQSEFGDVMLHGLDSNSTYIPLRTNKAQNINVAIRPWVERLSSGVVLFGGKLRVGYTMDADHSPLKQATNINEETASDRLRNFCKGFTWLRSDTRRSSTILGFAVAAGQYDGEAAVARLESGELAADFINRLESKYKQYNDVGFTANKKLAIEALNAAWILQSDKLFTPVPETTQLPDHIVGMQSGVLNQAQDAYSENVVSFEEKVAVKIATAEENTVQVDPAVEETTSSE